VYFAFDGALVSPFHDVPLWVDQKEGIANMIVEIPKGTHAKLEISKEEPLNPIRQDTKNGKLRYIHDAYPFNYGAFPQTWENPQEKDPDVGEVGDNDPVDVVEIGSRVHMTGEVIQVKILGAYAMIDEGETDWKIVCIDVKDELAAKLSKHSDIDPAKIKEVFTFLRDYKIPAGKPPNKFGFDAALLDKEFAVKVTQRTYHEWQSLISGKVGADKIQLKHTVSGASSRALISQDEAEKVVVNYVVHFLRSKI